MVDDGNDVVEVTVRWGGFVDGAVAVAEVSAVAVVVTPDGPEQPPTTRSTAMIDRQRITEVCPPDAVPAHVTEVRGSVW
jgi:hypothetical protein